MCKHSHCPVSNIRNQIAGNLGQYMAWNVAALNECNLLYLSLWKNNNEKIVPIKSTMIDMEQYIYLSQHEHQYVYY